jgi:small-conductance mechanosensitive channel
MNELLTWFETALEPGANPFLRAALLFSMALLAAAVLDRVAVAAARRLTSRTSTDLDDAVVAAVHTPAVASLLLAAAWMVLEPMTDHPMLRSAGVGVLGSSAVLLWCSALYKIGTATLHHLVKVQDRFNLVQARTLPLFDILLKTLVFGGGIYFAMLAWSVDVTAWLASAGVVGIAVGFAAKDTLGNLLGGLAILADAPYKLGDFLTLENGLRGKVTEIGLRSTRVVTRDDIEVILPNSLMSTVKIINEAGGRHPLERIRVSVLVPYDVDLQVAEEVLVQAAADVPLIIQDDPDLAPRVRYRSFDDSGVRCDLMGWIRLPEQRGPAIHLTIKAASLRLREAGIAQPFPQRVVRMEVAPPPVEGAGDD